MSTKHHVYIHEETVSGSPLLCGDTVRERLVCACGWKARTLFVLNPYGAGRDAKDTYPAASALEARAHLDPFTRDWNSLRQKFVGGFGPVEGRKDWPCEAATGSPYVQHPGCALITPRGATHLQLDGYFSSGTRLCIWCAVLHMNGRLAELTKKESE